MISKARWRLAHVAGAGGQADSAAHGLNLAPVGLLQILSIARRLWPTPVSLLVAGAFVLAPRPTAALIEKEAEVQGQKIGAMMSQLILSGFNHQQARSHPHLRVR